MIALSLLASVGAAGLLLLAPKGDEVDPLVRAVETFRAADPEIRTAVVNDIRAAVLASDDATVKGWIELGVRAHRELKTKPWPGLSYYEPKKYAPPFPRAFVPAEDEAAKWIYDQMRPYDNEPRCLGIRVRYDYASNRGYDLGADPALDDVLNDYLLGYPPDPDWIIAWLEMQFDFDDGLDDLAEYFGHAYCDRDGACYSNISIYDVWAAQREYGLEMPDGDAIAFARHILNDKSFVSPIPAGRKRAALYKEVSNGFQKYYQHRSWVEAAANVYLNPEAMIRTDHENLRERFWSSFVVLEDDPKRIADQFRKAGDRNKWYESIDRLHREDKRTLYAGHRWREERNAARWVVAEAAYGVLREYGFLYQ